MNGGRPGFIVWLTGMSGAGKSTVAAALATALEERQCHVEVLDGDEVRTWLSQELGFSREHRDVNVRRIGGVAVLLARHGVAVITAAISPFAAARREVRTLAEQAKVPFVEVHVTAALQALATRDVKGLYRKALAGEIPHFTGVSDPYEPPESPDAVIRSDADTVTEGRDRVLDVLQARGLVTAAGAA